MGNMGNVWSTVVYGRMSQPEVCMCNL